MSPSSVDVRHHPVQSRTDQGGVGISASRVPEQSKHQAQRVGVGRQRARLLEVAAVDRAPVREVRVEAVGQVEAAVEQHLENETAWEHAGRQLSFAEEPPAVHLPALAEFGVREEVRVRRFDAGRQTRVRGDHEPALLFRRRN